MTLQPSHPQDSGSVAGEQSPRPDWWLQLTADDFNALQPLLTFAQQAGLEKRGWLRFLIDRLRTWGRNGNAPRTSAMGPLQAARWLAHADNTGWFDLEDDALSLLSLSGLLAGPMGKQYGFTDAAERYRIALRLVDLGFRIARHATAGRVGSPVTHPEAR